MNCFQSGLKKACKASQFSKRSSKELRYLQRALLRVFFLISRTSILYKSNCSGRHDGALIGNY